MAQIGTQNSMNLKVEVQDDHEATRMVGRIAPVEGSTRVEVKARDEKKKKKKKRAGDETSEWGGRPVNVGGTGQVEVEGGDIDSEEFEDWDSDSDEPIERVRTAAEDEAEIAVVMKARRLAIPRSTNRDIHRRLFRPTARRKSRVRNSWKLKPYHRSKLRYLLSTLLEQRKWQDAAGVVSVLLGIPYASQRRSSVEGCWSDFAAAMEVLRRVDGPGSNDLRIRRMFRLLSLQQPNPRTRGEVQLEMALYLIKVGDREAAYNELRPIVDGIHFRENPVTNFCHGVNSYWLWYEKALEEVSTLEVTDNGRQIDRQGLDPMEGTGENDASEIYNQNLQSERGWTSQGNLGNDFGFIRDSQGSRAATQHGGDDMQSDELGALNVEPSLNIWQASQKSIYEETDEQGFVQTGEEFWRSVIVPNSKGLDRRLFPIQVPQDLDQRHYIVPMKDARTRDLHAAAVKHLKQTLASAPDMIPALLPLVQLLLAVHDIKGAVYEIDKCSDTLKKHFIPPSIKIILLESLDQKDPARLAACYHDVLIRNPLSVSSLKGLINLHASGNFETELLLECICLHLDVDPGHVITWQKLASCLLEVENRLQLPSRDGLDMMLMEGSMQKHVAEGLGCCPAQQLLWSYIQQLWSGRYKWWLRKHFSSEVISSEQQPNGYLQLLTYKAACAAHIYGPGKYFVEQARKALEKQQHLEGLNLIEHHCQRSLKLFVE